MLLKNKLVQLCLALGLGMIVMAIPRPEGTKFEIIGDPEKRILSAVSADFSADANDGQKTKGYVIRALNPGQAAATAKRLGEEAVRLGLTDAQVGYVDGLSPTAKRFLAILA